MAEKHQERYEDSDLYRIRHSAAHVMAEAVLEMFPQAKYTIGPPVEDGFYYDFELSRPLTPDDLSQIETERFASSVNFCQQSFVKRNLHVHNDLTLQEMKFGSK